MIDNYNKKNNFISKRKKQFEVKKKKITANVPKNALIELTNACNHACVFCFNPEMKRKHENLNEEIFKSFIISSVKEGLKEVGLYSTGEPFMTKNLEKYINFAKKNGVRRVYITTNGALANIEKVKKCIDAGLDSIKFSINAGSKETYKIIHGYDDFEKVFFNLDQIYNYKKEKKINLEILCSFIYNDLTINEIQNFKKKYSFYFKEIIFIKAKNQGGRTLEKVNLITKNINNNKKNKRKFQPCSMLWDRLHLTSEGYLTACCVDYENDLIYKKYDKDESIFNQFNSEKIKKLREKHLKNKLDGTICKNCLHNTNDEYSKTMNVEVQNSKKSETKLENMTERIRMIEKNTL